MVLREISVTVTPVNDAPVVHVPGMHKTYDYDGKLSLVKVDTLTVAEDTALAVRAAQTH